ncbi:MAG: hypothetical protein RLZ25_2055 [Pseudomonadota bacterium]|jgi:hypothetical protein
MVFIMPGLQNIRAKRRVFALALALLLASVTAPGLAIDSGIFIQRAQLDIKENRQVVTADIEYRFPPVALRALDEGIPLTFRVRLRIDRIRSWGWPDNLIQDERTIQLRYQPLAKSFQVSDLGSGAALHYTSLASVLDTLSHLRGWSIPSLPPADENERREASLSFEFDVESLPLPLRLVAYLSPDWTMETPPYRWLLAH